LSQSEVSSVEQYWNRIRDKFGDDRTWNQLTPEQQSYIIESINLMLLVLYRRV
jgi:hypothetical protein